MKKLWAVLLIYIFSLLSHSEARAKVISNIPSVMIESSDLVFRGRKLHSQSNPLSVKVLVTNNSTNETQTINLPAEFSKKRKLARVKMPIVGTDSKVQLQISGGNVPASNPEKTLVLIIDNPNLSSLDLFDADGNPLPSIPNNFGNNSNSSIGLQGPAGPAGPAGATGPQGPQGPSGTIPSSIPGSSIISAVNNSLKADMLDNNSQRLSLSGTTGQVVVSKANSGQLNLTLPSRSGTLVTSIDPTPVAVGSTIDVDNQSSINVANTNYVKLIDSSTGSLDTISQFIGGVQGQRLAIEFGNTIKLEIDNTGSTNEIQWGRGVVPGRLQDALAGEIYEFVFNGNAWYLMSRYTLF